MKNSLSVELGDVSGLQTLGPSCGILLLRGVPILLAKFVRRMLALSSTMPTCAPHSDARTAAAIPAGPAPITSTSKGCSELLFIRFHFHARFAKDLATPAVRSSIDRHAALEADSHSAQWPARFATHRLPARLSSHHQRHRNRGSGRHGHRRTIYRQRDWIRSSNQAWTNSFTVRDGK